MGRFIGLLLCLNKFVKHTHAMDMGFKRMIKGLLYIKLVILVSLMTSTLTSAQPLFEDDTQAVGGPFHVGETWGAAWGDFNGDGYPDLFSSNHGALNSILRNNGDGTFGEIVDEADSERIWTGAPDADIHGGSWSDFDNDGDQDLFVTRSSTGARFQLMENQGLGGFVEESAEFAVGPFGGGRMPMFFDYNNDGNLDLTLARNGSGGLVLFQWDPTLGPQGRYVVKSNEAGIFNQCLRNSTGYISDLFKNGTLHYICANEESVPERVYDTTTMPFTEVTSSIDPTGTNTDAVLADFNNDLLIDMMVNRGRVRPAGVDRISSERIEAWFSVGGTVDFEDAMTFTADGPISVNVFARNVGDAEGVRIGASGDTPPPLPVTLDPTDPDNFGLVAVRDERAVYIGYDETSQQWTIILSGGGGQSEGAYIVVDGTNLSEPVFSGGSAIDIALEPRFMLNDGTRLVDSGPRGIGSIQCGGIAAADFDNDMDIDVYMGCRSSLENFANRLYLNDGTGTFTLASNHGAEGITGVGIQSKTGTSGMAVAADYNVDGFMDLFVTNGNRLFPLLSKDGFSGGGPGQFFKNLANNGNNWIQIDLEGVTSNRDAFGAKVTVTAGGVSQFREQNGQYHRWSHDSRRIHVGLGTNTSADVTIDWPDGTTDTFTAVASNQIYRAVQGGAITAQAPALNSPSVSISTDELPEGETANLAVSIFPPSDQTVTVEYATFDGTATSTLDYQPEIGTLTFAPLQTEQFVSVQGLPDIENEDQETFGVLLSNPSNVLLNQPSGLVQLNDDDDADLNGPVISVSNASVFEGDDADFIISISEPPTQNATVSFTTVAGTATEGADFEARSGAITFTPGGALSVIRRVDTIDDGITESVESFSLRLYNTVNANLLDSEGMASLFDQGTVLPELSIDSVSVNEGASTDLTVTLSAASAVPVTVDFASSDVLATAGLDYTAVSGNLEFLPGEVSKTINLATLQDTERDGNETLNVILANPLNAQITDGVSLVTIIDDEPPIPFVSIGDVTVNEGGVAVLTVSLSLAISDTVSVDYLTVDGSAIAGSDYAPDGGTLTFAPGELSKDIELSTFSDIDDESDEVLTVELSNLVEALADQLVATVVILDNDDAPAGGPIVSADGGTVIEGNSLVFSVTLNSASSDIVRVDFATQSSNLPDSAEADVDYIPRSGVITFQPGQTTATRTVTTLSDSIAESDETFTFELSDPTNANILQFGAQGTIFDGATVVPEINIDSVSVDEGLLATVTVSLSEATTQVVSVDFATSDDSAIAGIDYVAASGNLTFAPGEISKTIELSSIQDTDRDGDETFNVTLSNASFGEFGTALGVVTILDDEPPLPSIDISNAQVIEGEAVSLTVSLSVVSATTVFVDYTTVDGSASAGSDYTAASGVLEFAPNELTKTIALVTAQDLDDESSENFTVELSNPIEAAVGQGVGTITLIDDDDAPINGPVVNVSGGSAIEGDQLVFTFTLSQASTDTVRADFDTFSSTPITAGIAEPDIDYTARSGRVTFAPGVTTVIRQVTLASDTLVEGDEVLGMQISNGQNANIDVSSAFGTIIDEDTVVPIISVDSASVDEGLGVDITVSLSAATTETVTVDFDSADNTAIAGSDYTAISGSLTFLPGELSTTVSVNTLQDADSEGDETFTIALSNADNATLSATAGTITIVDDEAPLPSITINSVAVGEGAVAMLDVSLSIPSTTPVLVDFTTVDGSATAGADYTASSGVLEFAPGELLQTISLSTEQDLNDESSENFTIELSSPVGSNIDQGIGVVTIIDDDDAPINGPVVSVSGDTSVEGNLVVFTFTLSQASNQVVRADFATVAGTAEEGVDYTERSGRVTFQPGVVSLTRSVTTLNDTVAESSESFSMAISNGENANIQVSSADGVILDDDAPTGPSISFTGNVADEGDLVVFTFTLSEPSTDVIRVDFETVAGSATAGADYTSRSGRVTFQPGIVSRTRSVDTAEDNVVESDETFTIQISNPENVAIANSSATGTIVNTTTASGITVSITGDSVNEGGTVVYTATLSQASTELVRVDFNTVDGTAVAGSDYTARSGRINFQPGVVSRTRSVVTSQDNQVEPDENFTMVISNPINASIQQSSAVGTIVNDD